jgi:hypothetical protein
MAFEHGMLHVWIDPRAEFHPRIDLLDVIRHWHRYDIEIAERIPIEQFGIFLVDLPAVSLFFRLFDAFGHHPIDILSKSIEHPWNIEYRVKT